MNVPLEHSWDAQRPAPRVVLRLSNRRPIAIPPIPSWLDTGPSQGPFDLSRALHELTADIAAKSPALAHIDPTKMAFSIVRARSATSHGLQARITPLRFHGGATISQRRGRNYQLQRLRIDGREMLYLVSFCLPRFLNRPFQDKLVTVFHELFHVGPKFDGDMRRLPGKNFAHSHSQKNYDAHMARLATAYLRDGADQSRYGFLHLSFAQLCAKHGAIVGLHLPRPLMVPVDAR